MKRLTFCLALLALLIAGTVGAYRIIEVPEVGARTVTMVMGGVADAGCICEGSPSVGPPEDASDYWPIALSDVNIWGGQAGFDPGANKTICQVDVLVYSVTDGGGLAAINWQVEVFGMSGTSLDSLVTGDATSDTQAITSTGWKQFSGLAAQVSSGSSYAIVLTRSDHTFDAANLINIRADGDGDSISGTWRTFNGDKTQASDRSPDDTQIKIYYCQ